MTWGWNWQTLMWIAWAATFAGVVITWLRVRSIGAHQAHHCLAGITLALALAQLVATLDDAGVVLPHQLRDLAQAFRQGEYDAIKRLLAGLDDLDLDDVDEDEGRD